MKKGRSEESQIGPSPYKVAERMGFEPMMEYNPHNSRVSTAVAVADLNGPVVGTDIARSRGAVQGSVCCDTEPCRTGDLAVDQRIVVGI